ncbi:MAG: hypothetical protein HDQ93_03645, partial [Desulfovibrio sp.]|nr:hypothetical protein [Desulfovibrio sp.]
MGANIWNNPASHFDIIKAICPQKAPPAQGYIANPAISFKSLNIKGFIGLYSSSWTMTQTWRNDSHTELEVIYTFPIASYSIISGLSATIAGKNARGRVVSTLDAERVYEEAITSGSLAIMVQKSSLGLATVNLGVLTPGERLKISLSCAKISSPYCTVMIGSADSGSRVSSASLMNTVMLAAIDISITPSSS